MSELRGAPNHMPSNVAHRHVHIGMVGGEKTGHQAHDRKSGYRAGVGEVVRCAAVVLLLDK
jgi:hypothetical protein